LHDESIFPYLNKRSFLVLGISSPSTLIGRN